MPFTMSCPGLSGSAWWTLVLPLTLLSLAPQRALASSDGLNASTAVGGWGGLGSRQRVVKLLHGQRWEHYSQYTISQKSGSTADDVSTASESSTGLDLGCDTLWVYQPLDHFSEEEPKSYSWQQRVHVCTRFWGKGSSEPLFFYAGPEAAVEEAFPTIFSDWAQQDGGLLVYAEHRYYGESMPGSLASVSALQWLTAEQAVADYANALRFVRQKYEVPSSAPAVAYGGSYGGNLAAYMRILYPDDFEVAVAASAPVKYLARAASFESTIYVPYWVLSMAVEDAGGSTCSEAVKLGFYTLQDWADIPRGRRQIEEAAGFCTPAKLDAYPDRMKFLAASLRTAWWALFQSLDWQTTVSVSDACQLMTPSPSDDDPRIAAVRGLAQVLLLTMSIGSDSQEYDCLPSYTTEPPYSYTMEDLEQWPEYLAYYYQGCREGFPTSSFFSSSTSEGSIFGEGSFNWERYASWCDLLYDLPDGPKPPSRMVYDEDYYRRATNIVFTNGYYDPWMAGSVNQGLGATVVAVLTPRTSHCSHLYAARPETDSEEFTAAQAQVKKYVEQMVASGRRKLLSNRRLLD